MQRISNIIYNDVKHTQTKDDGKKLWNAGNLTGIKKAQDVNKVDESRK